MHLSSAIPWGEGTPGMGGDFVQDPVEVLDFPLFEGDTERLDCRIPGPLIYIPFNNNSIHCYIFRSTKDSDTCK